MKLNHSAAAEVLTKTKRVDHITPVVRYLYWLPVCLRIYFRIQLLVYKALNGWGPKYISDLLLPYEPSRPLRPSGTRSAFYPRVKTKHGEAAFIWNKLPVTAGLLQLSVPLNQGWRPFCLLLSFIKSIFEPFDSFLRLLIFSLVFYLIFVFVFSLFLFLILLSLKSLF